MKPLPLSHARRPLEAARDAAGAPHVRAANWLDALYGLGYVHAHDRGTQLLFARSVASGRAAEEIVDAPELLETDRFFRRLGFFQNLRPEAEAFDPAARAQLQAYCDGVNDGLGGAGRTWPMWATGFAATPWDIEAVLLVGQLLSFGGLAIGQMHQERLLTQLVQAGAPEEGLRELFGARLDGVDFDLLRHVRLAKQLSDEALELMTDLPQIAGSNAWATAPWRGAGGAALLAADPHLEVNRLPAIWHEVVLRWGDEYLLGATLPGCPLFAVARTRRLAWGVTYMKGDTIDWFIEDCRRAGDAGWQYRRGDRWLPFRERQEIIRRKGGGEETTRVCENDLGVLELDPNERGPGYYLSVAWAGARPGAGRAIPVWLEVAAAGSTAEAMEIARSSPQPSLCWIFADREGHIGKQCSGRFPLRGGGQIGLAPIPAWDERNHWRGWIDPGLLPREYDPPEGFVATANEEQNPPGGPVFCTQPLSDYRLRRIVERLRALPRATLEHFRDLQYDLLSTQARDLLEVFLPHVPEGPARRRLAAWDRRYGPESREATLFQRLYRNVLVEVFGHQEHLGWLRTMYLSSRAGFSGMLLEAADRALRRSESFWWRGRDKAALIRAAAEKLGPDDDRPWGEVNTFHFTDRYFGGHQVGRLLGSQSRRYPMPGCHATPFQGHVLQTAKRESTFAPSYHFVTDLSTDEAWTNLPGGPSENMFSRLYNCDVPRWLTGQYKRLGASEPPT